MHLPAAELIHLLHETPHAILSTHSAQLPGFPFGTAVPLILDEYHRPLLLISALAEHTKNLQADPKASLAVVDSSSENIQDARRATLVGYFRKYEPDSETISRYLRYRPAAERYLQLDFSFYRMEIEHVRYIGGIGQMGWLDMPKREERLVLSPAEENHLLSSLDSIHLQGLTILGLDLYGIDCLLAGSRKRIRYEAPLHPEELSTALPAVIHRNTAPRLKTSNTDPTT